MVKAVGLSFSSMISNGALLKLSFVQKVLLFVSSPEMYGGVVGSIDDVLEMGACFDTALLPKIYQPNFEHCRIGGMHFFREAAEEIPR